MSNDYEFEFANYDLEIDQDGNLSVKRETADLKRPGDYGCDPLPDGMFRMVPSGDVVDAEEKERRLR